MIIELKRTSRVLTKTDLEEQAKKYISALEAAKAKNPEEARYPIEAVCIVGTLPRGWSNPESRKKDEESLRAWSIRVMSYDELIDNASRPQAIATSIARQAPLVPSGGVRNRASPRAPRLASSRTLGRVEAQSINAVIAWPIGA